MSIKSKVFETLLGGLPPANAYNFLVIFGYLDFSLVSAFAHQCNWPSQKRPQLTVKFKGRSFNLPAYTEDSSGILTIAFHENMAFYVRNQLKKYLADSDNPMSVRYFDIDLINLSPAMLPVTRTQFTKCWFTERSVASLSAQDITTPVSWTGSFVYNGIKEIPLIPGTSPIDYLAMETALINVQKGIIRTIHAARDNA